MSPITVSPPTRHPLLRVLRVYLDQNHWIYLSSALHGRPRSQAEADAATVVLASVDAGLASYPLSLAHLEETWRQRRAAKRLPLADTMAAVSRNHTIAPPSALLPGELDRALRARFGEPTHVRALQPFGIGLAHMSDGEAPQLGAEVMRVLLRRYPGLDRRRITDCVDALMIGGPDVDLPFGDLTPPPREVSVSFAAEEQAQLERFAAHGSNTDERRRAVAARMLLDMREPLHEAQRRTSISTDELLALGGQGLTAFMRELPSRDALLELATLQHRNPQTRWQPNDLNDLVYISLAVGYCDVVVTERRWAANLNDSDVPRRRDTKVLARLADLPQLLVA